mmetsp:Transcript_429/g.1075  ORF Transcript_429/g.1075 Transcript_429/m.1075 type:complete len:190 (+) Transcript_429:88-657(+)
MQQLKSAGQPASEVVINWKPFFIDPGTKEDGEEYMAYNRRRWGGDGWTNSLPGKREGDKFTNWKVWPNTINAARLIHRAGEVGGWQLQDKAKGMMFRLCYEEGKNVSDLDVLVEAASELGIPDAAEYLRSDKGRNDVVKQAREASRMGIGGVPFFVCYNEADDSEPVTFSGAQPAKTIAKILKQLAAAS